DPQQLARGANPARQAAVHTRGRPILRVRQVARQPDAREDFIMKRIALASVCLAAAVGTGFAVYPAEVTQYAGVGAQAGLRAWGNIEANPVPVLLAVGTFVLTVIYHKARGKSLRESVEVAATRVTVLTPPRASPEVENAVVRRAKARATRSQLLADQIGLQNRHRKLPEEGVKAEKEGG